MLTLGLALHGVTSRPYEQTRAATNGPDVIADVQPAGAAFVADEAHLAQLDSEPVEHFLNLKLANPGAAAAFASQYNDSASSSGPYVTPWQGIASADAKVIANVQLVLFTGSWLLALLALASVAVLVGGRMAEQTRRVGLLKIRLSAHLPVPLLLGVRIVLRRPRRLLLAALSVAVTGSGIVAVLIQHGSGAGWSFGRQLSEATSLVSVMLVTLAAVNAVFIAWTTALEARLLWWP